MGTVWVQYVFSMSIVYEYIVGCRWWGEEMVCACGEGGRERGSA
jgi:hypothetical protein